jgi:hypothetical protein
MSNAMGRIGVEQKIRGAVAADTTHGVDGHSLLRQIDGDICGASASPDRHLVEGQQRSLSRK